MRAQRRSPEGVPPTATLPSVDPDYGTALSGDMKTRLARLDWRGIERSLWQWGYAKTPPLLSPSECAELIGLYADERRRSEEHTSELQSLAYLVCRLLLEKKKNKLGTYYLSNLYIDCFHS